MLVEKTAIPDLLVITPRRFGDARGFFEETWNQAAFEKEGITLEFVQDNHSMSAEAGTIRGLHFQCPPSAQDKLVRCGRGRVIDVGVDIRKGSPTYGHWHAEELSFENGKMLLVPAGFAHGFATLEADCEVCYKCSGFYAPETEGSIRFDDPALGIDWGIENGKAILSEKDAAAPLLSEFESPFVYGN